MTRFFGPPSEQEPTAQRLQLRPVRTIGLVAAGLIVTVVAADVISTWSDWHSYWTARDFLDGVSDVGLAELTEADDFALRSAVILVVAQLVAGVVFLVWLWRARENAEWINPGVEQRRRRGWVIGGWFCPVVNLWFPKMIVEDIWQASLPRDAESRDFRPMAPSRLVLAWWLVFVAQYPISIWIRIRDRDEISLDALHDAAIAYTIGTALYVPAAVLVVLIIQRISAWQHQAAQAPMSATG